MIAAIRKLRPRRRSNVNGSFPIRFQALSLIFAILVMFILARGTISIPAAEGVLPRTQQVPAITPQLVDTLGRPVASPRVGDFVAIEATVRNNDTVEHRVTFIVQIKDSSGVVVFLGWIGGINLAPDSSLKPALASALPAPGTYVAEVFVLTSVVEGIPLSSARSLNFTVSG